MDHPKSTAGTETSSKEMSFLLSREERGDPSDLGNASSGPSAPSLQLLNPVDDHGMDPPSYSSVMAQDKIAERSQTRPSSLLENHPALGIPLVEISQPQPDPTASITVQPEPSAIGFKESVLAAGEPQPPNPQSVIIVSTDDEAAKKREQLRKMTELDFLPIVVPDLSCHHYVHHGNSWESDSGGDGCCGDDCCGDGCCGDGCCEGDVDCGGCDDCTIL
ncbi:uncharacterized protein LOC124404266 [Diprion similis]|uniref:uncharacterized protein LOC124404266 n=1 Tax=Diprion similis TaxID=362088 RepID=UPI001EF78FC9|nr:uncharacterized protein LOC124404266 [Diprion similis]